MFDEFLRVAGDFGKVLEGVNKLTKGSGSKLDNLLQHLQDKNRVSQLSLFRTVLKGYDELSAQDEAGPEFGEIRRVCKMLSGIDLTAPFFLNGMVLNERWFSPRSLRLDAQIGSDFEPFQKVIRGLVFQEDLIPMNCTLVLNLFDALSQTTTNTGRYDFNYVG